MTRYRLPEALGGMELPEDTGGVMDPDTEDYLLRFDIPGVGVIRVQRKALIEVKPPPPPEPPLLSVVQVDERFYQRRSTTGINWFLVGSSNVWETWQRLCDDRSKPTVYLLQPESLPAWERELLEGQR